MIADPGSEAMGQLGEEGSQARAIERGAEIGVGRLGPRQGEIVAERIA